MLKLLMLTCFKKKYVIFTWEKISNVSNGYIKLKGLKICWQSARAIYMSMAEL